MGESTKVLGKTIICMVKVLILGRMEEDMMVSFVLFLRIFKN